MSVQINTGNSEETDTAQKAVSLGYLCSDKTIRPVLKSLATHTPATCAACEPDVWGLSARCVQSGATVWRGGPLTARA
jgi:hypothetical protein